MKQKGITNAAALVGGTAAWKGQKYPMEGPDVKP
jgi:rhodanese-related sulfurtransferase